jgi:hypothetical protein
MGKANFGIVLENPHEPVLTDFPEGGWAQVDSEIKVSRECVKRHDGTIHSFIRPSDTKTYLTSQRARICSLQLLGLEGRVRNIQVTL